LDSFLILKDTFLKLGIVFLGVAAHERRERKNREVEEWQGRRSKERK
jgi:hypothetical protein